jgi:hypothetical protein
MNKTIATIAIAGSLAVSLSAFANKGAEYKAHHHHDNLDWSKGWYIGAGVNGNAESTMNLNGSPEVFDHYLESAGISEVEMSTTDIGFDAYIGRDISKHWAVELGYTWLGNQFFDAEISEVEYYDVEVQQWNAHLVGIGKLPIGEYFNVFAKGGVAYFSSTQEFENEFTGVEATDTIHTMALTYGAGIEVTWDNWGVRGEYNVIWPANNVRDDFYVADIISANIYYKFN